MGCGVSGYSVYRFKVISFRVQGSGFGVQGSGFRVQGSRLRVQGSGFLGYTVLVVGHIPVSIVRVGASGARPAAATAAAAAAACVTEAEAGGLATHGTPPRGLLDPALTLDVGFWV